MEQKKLEIVAKVKEKKKDYGIIRVDQALLKRVKRLVDKANKKSLGKRVKARDILANLLDVVGEEVIGKAIKIAQEKSLSFKEKQEAFVKANMGRFKGDREQFERKMVELMGDFLGAKQGLIGAFIAGVILTIHG